MRKGKGNGEKKGRVGERVKGKWRGEKQEIGEGKENGKGKGKGG